MKNKLILKILFSTNVDIRKSREKNFLSVFAVFFDMNQIMQPEKF